MSEESDQVFKEMERTANLNKPAVPKAEDLEKEIDETAAEFLKKENENGRNDRINSGTVPE